MNKSQFIEKLAKELSYSVDKCIIINEILESNFFISKNNKDKIIEEFVCKLGIDYKDAINIYETAVKIINDEVKNKLRHPFKSKD